MFLQWVFLSQMIVNIVDDILVFGSTQQEHNHNVIAFLERCLGLIWISM